jgi:hypothetical protein
MGTTLSIIAVVVLLVLLVVSVNFAPPERRTSVSQRGL